MATRRKSTGFTEFKQEETASVEQLIEVITDEILETVAQSEAEVNPVVITEPPFVAPEIIPTDDVGPRFVEETATPRPQVVTPAATPQLQPPPKRHPRNIPKFSRYK